MGLTDNPIYRKLQLLSTTLEVHMKKMLVLCMLSMLTACGTVKGVGNDISGLADWTKDKMTGK